MNDNVFLNNYFNKFKKLLDHNYIDDLIKLKKICLSIKEKQKKIIIAGNGGSAAISSHFSVDLTKNAKIRCINFNEADLITCFSNDYGYEKWLENAVKYYCDRGDLLILVSTSGISKNMLSAARFFKKKKNWQINYVHWKKKK